MNTDKFWSLVNKISPDGCWLWTGGQDGQGYGKVYEGDSDHRLRAHQVAWLLTHGTKATSAVRHTCNTFLCVNPAHLTTGSEGHPNAKKTECVNGHPFDSANTYITPAGKRQCRTCRQQRAAERCRRIRQPKGKAL